MNTDGICEFLSALQAQIGHFADIAQLGERQTEDLKVPGSIPGVGSVVILLQVFYFFRPLRCVSFTGKVSLREVLSLW